MDEGPAGRKDAQLIPLGVDEALGIRGIRHGGDHPADPVEAVGGHLFGGAGQVLRRGGHIGVERHHGIERVGGISHPLNGALLRRDVRTDLDKSHKVVAVDADGAVHAALALVAVAGVGVIGRALVVGGQHIFDILRGQLLLGHHAPGQVIGARGVVGVRAVPDPGVGIEGAEHVPGTGRVVNVVGVVVAAKSVPRVQASVQRQVEMIGREELPQVRRAHIVFFVAIGIVQVKAVDAQLVGHDHVGIIRHAAGHPVVAADGLQPPDLVDILERDAVHLIGAVGLQQAAQPLHALPGRVDIGQHQIDDILLADAAGHLRGIAHGRLVHHQRVSPQHAGVGGDGLGSGHAHIGGIDTGRGPDALALHSVWHGRHPHGIARQGDLHMGQHGFVNSRVLLRLHDHKFFGREMPRTGIVVAGDHGGAVIGCVFTNKDRCTSHKFFPPKFQISVCWDYCSLFCPKRQERQKARRLCIRRRAFPKEKEWGLIAKRKEDRKLTSP